MLTIIRKKYIVSTSLKRFAGVAQLVERRTENPYVVSPILTAGIFRTCPCGRSFFHARIFPRVQIPNSYPLILLKLKFLDIIRAMNWLIIAPNLKNKNLKLVEDFLDERQIIPHEIYIFEGLGKDELYDGVKHVMQATHCIILDSEEMCSLPDYDFMMGLLVGKNVTTFVHMGSRKDTRFESFESNRHSVCHTYSSVEDILKHLEKNFSNFLKEDKQRQALVQLFTMGIPFTSDCFATALEKDDDDTCQLFLDAGMMVNARTSDGVPLVCVATRSDCEEKVRWLVDAGADINAVSADRGYSAVMDAVWRKNLNLTKYFIENGADLSFMSSDGQPILVLAVGNGNSQIVELLLENGADPDVKDSMGMSARGYANLFKKPDMVEAFAKYPPKEAS